MSPSPTRRSPALAPVVALLAIMTMPIVTACGSSGRRTDVPTLSAPATSSHAPVADPASPAAAIADPGTVRIAMRKDSCAVSAATFPSGSRTFTVDNQGGAVGEVYVYASDGTKVGEVENVGPGTRRDLTVTLAAGAYQVACKPASVGKGIGTTITVTG